MKKKPKCEFEAKGKAPCDVTLPKPNQLCQACRPFWKRQKSVTPTR